jgi:HPt (histidine-containing phosphotransfer) domain-containing protein
MDDYITKPIRQADLAAALGRLLHDTATVESPSIAAEPQLEHAVDRNVLDRLRELEQAGTPGLVAQLKALFVEDTPRQLTELRAFARAGDCAGIAKAAHTMKGSAANLGAHDMVRICAELQSRAEGGHIDAVASRIDKLEQQFLAVRAALACEETAS